jgi:hypothetical protein
VYTGELEQEVRERKQGEAASQETAACLDDRSHRLLDVQEDERRHMPESYTTRLRNCSPD